MEFFKLDDIRIASSNKIEITEYFKDLLISGNQNLIITFNLDFYRIASENEIFNKLCTEADILFPDGVGIVSLIKHKYKRNINRITGNDLFAIILNLSNEVTIKAAFVGSSLSVLKKLKERIKKEFPKLEIVAISPPLFFEKHDSLNKPVINELKTAKPDILLAALGCPRQEIWLRDNIKEIGAKINIGVGAVFDYYSGNKKRAPAIIQNLSLEWLWRMLHEPTRLTERYLFKDLPFYIKKRLNK